MIISGMFLLPLYISWNTDPIIVSAGWLDVRWYSLFFAAAFIVSYVLLQKQFTAEKVSIRLLDKLTLYVAVGTVIGARLGHCLFYDFDYYSHHLLEIFLPVTFTPDFQFVGYQGLASHGGAAGILISVILFSRKYHVHLLWVLDKLSLVIPLAGCSIRLGNFMNSEIVGKPSDAPWAIVFERVDHLPRHPAQLYEAIGYLIIFLCLNFVFKRMEKKPGFLFGIFLIALFAVRFALEFLKENQAEFENEMTINMGQWLSIPFILFGIVLVVIKSREREHAQAEYI